MTFSSDYALRFDKQFNEEVSKFINTKAKDTIELNKQYKQLSEGAKKVLNTSYGLNL